MIKIERNPVPPPLLAIEEQKTKGIYNKPDVIQRLKEDSHDMMIFVILRYAIGIILWMSMQGF